MDHLYHTDLQGVCHLSDQAIIELAYQDKIADAMFEWQDDNSKQQFENMSRYLDSWPFRAEAPDPAVRTWFTPDEYVLMDLDQYVLSRCANDQEKSRALQELAIIHHLQAESIFKHLIYLVDTWRSQGAVWGVGRGSSVSCFVLYVIGVNKINPLDYDLPMQEFFKIDPSRVLNNQ